VRRAPKNHRPPATPRPEFKKTVVPAGLGAAALPDRAEAFSLDSCAPVCWTPIVSALSKAADSSSDIPGKIVGNRRVPRTMDPAHDTKEGARAWRRALPTPFVPKGVYRFTSHEEADEWLWKMLTRKRP